MAFLAFTHRHWCVDPFGQSCLPVRARPESSEFRFLPISSPSFVYLYPLPASFIEAISFRSSPQTKSGFIYMLGTSSCLFHVFLCCTDYFTHQNAWLSPRCAPCLHRLTSSSSQVPASIYLWQNRAGNFTMSVKYAENHFIEAYLMVRGLQLILQ